MTTSPVISITEEILGEIERAGWKLVPVERIHTALEAVQNAMLDAYNNAYQECCGRGQYQCCGDPDVAWSVEDQHIMNALSPAQRELSALLAAAPAAPAAPVAQEPVALPDGITISKDFFGTVHIKLGDFDFIQIKYDHRYTYNSHQEWVANRIVEAITAPPAAKHSDAVAVPRELLAEAESIIDSYAEALKASYAPGGEWEGEEAAHDEYELEAGVASKLRALLAGGAE